MIRMWLQRHILLFLLIIVYVILAYLNSTTIPLSKAPDEYAHLLYSRFIAENYRLPVTDAERQQAGYKSDQPPIYHGLLALATGWVETNIPPKLKMTWDTPQRKLVDIILPRAMIVRTEDETWPYRGEILAWLVGRWLSILFGILTIVLVYTIALEIFPGQFLLALAAAATLAFIPRFTFISAVLSDEGILAVFIGLYFWALVRVAKGRTGFWNYAHVGLFMGLALITKYSAVVLILEFLIFLLILLLRKEINWRKGTRGAVITFVTFFVITAGWFVFQTWHFNRIDELGLIRGIVQPLIAGDETEADSTTFVVASTLTATESAQPIRQVEGSIWDWIRVFFIEFWEVEVYGKPPLYPSIYNLLLMGGICLIVAIGLVRIWRENKDRERFWLILLLLHVFIFVPIPLLRYLITGRIHDTAQARYIVFSAAPAVGILLAWGIARLSGFKFFNKDGPHTTDSWTQWGLLALVVVTFYLSIAQWYHYLNAFPPPLPVRAGVAFTTPLSQSMSVVFNDGLKLAGYYHQVEDNALRVILDWQSLTNAHEDYYTELSLLDNQGRIVAQTAAHPAQGRYPVRAWDPGDNIRQEIVLPLPGLMAGTYELQLRLVGWQEPLLTIDSTEWISLASVDIRNNVSYSSTPRFAADATILTGFDLWQDGKMVSDRPVYRYLASIPVTVSAATDNLLEDMTMSLWLVDSAGERYPSIAGAGMSRTFMVDYNWPSGDYALEAEIWRQGELVEQMRSDLILTVENRPIPFEPPPMQYQLDANFANKILLLGYDLPSRRIQPGQGLPLVLHWQGLQQMKEDYVIFNRLLDQNQQAWGGYDRLPKELYNTFLWVPGEVVSDGFAIPVDPNTPDGVYKISLGLYLEQDGTAVSLPMVVDGEFVDMTGVTIGPIKVGGPPPGVTLSAQEITPDSSLSIKLGEPPIILLHGYDLNLENDQLKLKIYWESLAQTSIDWSVFTHLRNKTGEVIAQKDGPLGGGDYPASLWDPGEVVVDEIVVPIESLSDATYNLYIGLYNLATGERILIPDSAANEIFIQAVDLNEQ